MRSNFFTRENEEEKIYKRAILDNSKKFILNWVFGCLLIIGTVISVILSGGLILFIDGGITLTYIIV